MLTVVYSNSSSALCFVIQQPCNLIVKKHLKALQNSLQPKRNRFLKGGRHMDKIMSQHIFFLEFGGTSVSFPHMKWYKVGLTSHLCVFDIMKFGNAWSKNYSYLNNFLIFINVKKAWKRKKLNAWLQIDIFAYIFNAQKSAVHLN